MISNHDKMYILFAFFIAFFCCLGEANKQPYTVATDTLTDHRHPLKSDLPPVLPPLKLIRGYEFEDHIGENVSVKRDSIRVHVLSREGGLIEQVDGGQRGPVGAYHFRIDSLRSAYHGSGRFYRQELEPRYLPEPYFAKGRLAKWGQEYVYQIRMKLTDNYETGGEYVGLFSTKNDQHTDRIGSVSLYSEGDHYLVKIHYAREHGVGGWGTKVYTRYDQEGNKLIPDVDFDNNKKMGKPWTKFVRIYKDLGQWVVWTVHVKWSYQDDGFVRIYKDDKLFHSYDGPNSFRDDYGPYVKFGPYNSYWKHYNKTKSAVQEVYVDYFRIYVPK